MHTSFKAATDDGDDHILLRWGHFIIAGQAAAAR